MVSQFMRHCVHEQVLRMKIYHFRDIFLYDIYFWYNQKPSVTEAWQEEWTNSDARNQFLIVNATARVPGSDLPRRLWSLLNRFRTDQGLCAANLHLWGLRADPLSLWARTTTVDDAYCRGLSPHPTTRRTESTPQWWRSSRRMAWQDKQTLEEDFRIYIYIYIYIYTSV